MKCGRCLHGMASLALAVAWLGWLSYAQVIGDISRFAQIDAESLEYKDAFGHGDLFSDVDGDGNRDIVIGQPGARGGEGVVTFLLLHRNITLKGFRHFSQFDLIGTRQVNSGFASSVSNVGDVDGDGFDDLAVSHQGFKLGRVYLVFVDQDGGPKGFVTLESGVLNFNAATVGFGTHTAGVGDLNGDGVPDVVVGEETENKYGALHVLLLSRQGGVLETSVIARSAEAQDSFARFPIGIDDLDGNGVVDIVGSGLVTTETTTSGYFEIMFLDSSGEAINKVKVDRKTKDSAFPSVQREDVFAYHHVLPLGDVDSDLYSDFLVPVLNTTGATSLYVCGLKSDGSIRRSRSISSKVFGHQLQNGWPGVGLFLMGDYDSDGLLDVAGVSGDGSSLSIASLTIQRKAAMQQCGNNYECVSGQCIFGLCSSECARTLSCHNDSLGLVQWPPLSGDFSIEVWIRVGAESFSNQTQFQILTRIGKETTEFSLDILSDARISFTLGNSLDSQQPLLSIATPAGALVPGVYNQIKVAVSGVAATLTVSCTSCVTQVEVQDVVTEGERVATSYLDPIVLGDLDSSDLHNGTTSCFDGEVIIAAIDGNPSLLCLDYDACHFTSPDSPPCFSSCIDHPPPSIWYTCNECPEWYVSPMGDDDCKDPMDGCADPYPCYQGPNNLTAPCYDIPSFIALEVEMEFVCGSCPEGTTGNGEECIDAFNACIDLEKPHLCFSAELCIDDPPPSNNYSCGPCPAGYRGDGYDCQDFDACSANPAACPDDHFCVDRIPPSEAFDCESCLDAGPCCPNPCFQGGTCVAIGSSFECACPLGYEGDGVNCTDINACSASPPPCFPGAQCDDLPPPALEAKCGACPAGYAGDGSFSGCVDYDPCREVPDFCDATAECIDLPPPSMSANCVILTMNPTTNPTDGPTDNSNGCNPNPCFSIVDEIRGIDFQADCNIVSSSAASVPSAPSFICGACPENLGFSADPSGNQSHCVDTDGCLAQQALTGALPCFPGVQCDDVSAPGIGFLCGLCPSGYEGSGNFGDCFEIDGCNTNPPPCFAGVQCVDLPPPFTNALCGQCPLGYSGNGSFSGGCVDFDACIGSSCFSGPGGECRDHPPPSYGATCTCAEGYIGDGLNNCTEFDACSNGGDQVCPTDQPCVDLPPPSFGFQCGTCPMGTVSDVTASLLSSNQSVSCIEFDACMEFPCPAAALCTDLPAPSLGFNCTDCAEGLVVSANQTVCVQPETSEPTASPTFSPSPEPTNFTRSPSLLPTQFPTVESSSSMQAIILFHNLTISLWSDPGELFESTARAWMASVLLAGGRSDPKALIISLEESQTSEALFEGNKNGSINYLQTGIRVLFTVTDESLQARLNAMSDAVLLRPPNSYLGSFSIVELRAGEIDWLSTRSNLFPPETMPSESYENCLVLLSDIALQLHYTVEGTRLKGKLQGNAGGWLGLGFPLLENEKPLVQDATMHSGGRGTDIIIGFVHTEGVGFGDYWTTERLLPQLDNKQLTSFTGAGLEIGETTSMYVTFERQLDTGDTEQDRNLLPVDRDRVLLFAARVQSGGDGVLHGKHSHKGGVLVNFAKASSCKSPTKASPTTEGSGTLAIILSFVLVLLMCLVFAYFCWFKTRRELWLFKKELSKSNAGKVDALNFAGDPEAGGWLNISPRSKQNADFGENKVDEAEVGALLSGSERHSEA